MSGVEIKIGGRVYGGWKSAQVELSMERIAGTFELGISSRWPGLDTSRPILPGDRCEVLIDGEPVITGWVDGVSPGYDAGRHECRVSGRDATGDLVDCSAIHKSGQWTKYSLTKIVEDLCRPFGIKVTAATDVGAPLSHSIQEGESAFECIERACRMKAVLPVSDGRGGLLLVRAVTGAPTERLAEGENILAVQGHFSQQERHSVYIIKGQTRSTDGISIAPETHIQVRAEATDPGVKRYRPLVVLAENRGVHATYKDRAQWESNVRRGRASRVTVTVQGWRGSSGKLWRPNSMVQFVSPALELDIELLVSAVTLHCDEQGIRTELSLVDRAAFDLIVGKAAAGAVGKIREKQQGEHHGRKKSISNQWGLF